MDSAEVLDILCGLAADEPLGEKLIPMLVKVRDVNTSDDDGNPPLWYAASKNPSVSVLNTLLEAGAVPDFNILCTAIVHNPNPDIAKHLYRKLAPLRRESLDHAFLLAAASNTSDELIRFFAQEGADIQATLPMDIYPHADEDEYDLESEEDDDGLWMEDGDPVMQNALVVAIYENPEPAGMVAHLIKMGVAVDTVDEEGYTVLMHALDNLDVVKALLSGGVDVDAVDLAGHTALMHACEGENPEAALALIQAGADVNKVSDYGENALHHALVCHMKENMDVVRALIAAGADVNLPDGDGYSPLHLARMNCAGDAVVALLEGAGAVLGGLDFN